jgi:hypothetical protein
VKSESSRASISIPPQSINSAGVAPPANVIPAEVAPNNRVRARTIGAERTIGRLLRSGAMLSVGLFASSILLETIPQTQQVGIAIDLLRKGGLVVLLVTPLARLTAAAAVLAMKGEWRYALYGAGVLLLLALSVGAGLGV